MSSEHECYICHKKLDLYARWHNDKSICDNCLITLIYPQEIEQKDQTISELLKALEFAVDELDDAKDMLRECGKHDWADTLNASVDYFKAKAKEELNNDR